MNSNPSEGSSRSPERTRPWLLPKSPAPDEADGSPDEDDSAPHAPSSSDHPPDGLHPDPTDGPSCGSTAPSARTPGTTPPGFDPLEPIPPSGLETPPRSEEHTSELQSLAY